MSYYCLFEVWHAIVADFISVLINDLAEPVRPEERFVD